MSTTTAPQSNDTHETTERVLGIAMIGGGLMCKAHTMAYRNLRTVYGRLPARLRQVMLVDATEELARSGAEQYGYKKWSTSWQDAIDDPDVDIIEIVTPNYLHKDLAIAAARAGKHVSCEKPLALTAADAHEMVEAAEESGVKTIVGFTYLRNPAVVFARQLVDSGEIGDPVSFSGVFAIDSATDPSIPISWRQERAHAGSGALGDLGAHVIALARYLVGPIESVAGLTRTTVAKRPASAGNLGYGEKADESAPLRDVENDDIVMFLTSFANGAMGTIEASRVSSGRSYELGFTLTGTKGAIRFDQQNMYRLEVRLASDPAGTTGFHSVQVGPDHGDYSVLWPVPGINISIHDLKFFEAYDFITAIADDSTAYPDFREGWEVSKVLDAVEASASTHGWVKVS